MIGSIKDILGKQCNEKELMLVRAVEDKDYTGTIIGNSKVMAAGLYVTKQKERKDKKEKKKNS